MPRSNDDEIQVTVDELRQLMEHRGQEGFAKLVNEFGNVENLCKALNTSPNEGLKGDLSDLEERQKEFGTNVIPTKKSKSFIKLFLVALDDITLIILTVAAIVSLGISFYRFDDDEAKTSQINDEMSLEWIEGTAILLTVFIVMFVTGLNNYTKERQFRALQNRIEDEHVIAVIRNGNSRLLPVSQLVVGDICQIKYGDILPADGILIQNNDLKVDESSLTGESDLVKKGEQYKDVSLLSGTHVMEGSGRMLVTAVGLNSQTGIIMTLLGATKSDKKSKGKDKDAKLNGYGNGNGKGKMNIRKLSC